MFSFRNLLLVSSCFLVSPWMQTAEAGHHRRGRCCDCGAPACQVVYQTVERTVMVPNWVTENRTMNFVECRPEQRTSTYTCYRPVYETKDVQYEVMVPKYETRTRTVNYTVCKPVMATKTVEYNVMVPYTEQRQGTRQVCRMVPVTQKRTVCEDQGSWQQVVQTYKVGCGDCAQTCSRACNVWVPKLVTKEVEYTCMRPQMEQVAYEYNVTLCKPETRTREVQTCNYVNEQQSREVQYQVCVPEKQMVTRPVTSCRLVAEERTATYTVPVAHTVQREVPIQVCQWVAKKVTCQVPVRVPCNTCNGCGTPAAPPASPSDQQNPAARRNAPAPVQAAPVKTAPAETAVTQTAAATGPEEIPAGRIF